MSKRPKFHFKNRGEFDKHVIENAEYYTACAYLGGAKFDTLKAKSLSEAREKARDLIKVHKCRVMIYAVMGPNSAFIEGVV